MIFFSKHINNAYPLLTVLLIILFSLFPVPSSLAVDFLLRPKGLVYIPYGDGNYSPDGAVRYNLGGGAEVGFEIDFSSIWPNPVGLGFSLGAEGGMLNNSLAIEGSGSNVNLYFAGGSLGVGFFPLSRLFTRIDGGAGVYIPTMDGSNGPLSYYWKAGGEIGFRFSPSFILAVNGAWRQYEDRRENYNPASSGISAGITLQIAFSAGGSHEEGARSELIQDIPVYPAFLQLYQTNPIGTLQIRNRENAEIRDVRVSFRASPYTSSEFYCGTIPVIQRGRTAEIDLVADFSQELLRFTDSGRILGEVVIRYRFLGQERTAVSVVTVASHNRNKTTIDDVTSLAAFISPTSPEVLDFSRYIIGLARSRRRVGHNQNLQYSAWLFEGLRAYGIRMGETFNLEDEVQFPAETLAFRTGNACDLALLFATTLECSGITSAIMKIGSDYIVAINLSINAAAAETLFFDNRRVININDEIWLPVAMSSYNEGFMEAWTRAVVTLNHAFETDTMAEFVIISEAWGFYQPAPLPGLGMRLVRIDSDPIISGSEAALNLYVNQDIVPWIWRVENQLRSAPTAALYNRYGILLARAGRVAEAKSNYERAAGMGSVPAMTNRGNLALNERDYGTAERWFRAALQAEPQNTAAIRGLDRVEGRR